MATTSTLDSPMLATLTGDLCLLAGLAVLLLPLLATELSRPRDGAWGAVVLLLGLVLVTSSDRLRGAPMLGVACAGLLISRLGAEVGQARWQQLSDEERQRLGSRERWTTSLQQLTTVLASLVSATADTLKSLKPAAKTGTNKLWVRPEQPPEQPSTGADLDTPPSGEAFEQAENSQDSEDQTNEASNDKDAAAETPGIKKQRKKLWIRPDSSEPSLETQEVSATPSANNDVNETDGLKAETSTNKFEEGSADNAIETASNSAANTTENTARTDED
jgi:hypothetical protein